MYYLRIVISLGLELANFSARDLTHFIQILSDFSEIGVLDYCGMLQVLSLLTKGVRILILIAYLSACSLAQSFQIQSDIV